MPSDLESRDIRPLPASDAGREVAVDQPFRRRPDEAVATKEAALGRIAGWFPPHRAGVSTKEELLVAECSFKRVRLHEHWIRASEDSGHHGARERSGHAYLHAPLVDVRLRWLERPSSVTSDSQPTSLNAGTPAR